MAYATIRDLAGPAGYLEHVELNDEDVVTVLTGMLARIEDVVDKYLGFSFEEFAADTEKTIRAGYGAYLALPAHSLGTITQVTTISGQDLDGLWEELDHGSLYAVDESGYEGNWNAGRYLVTADWGYGPCPGDVKEVVLQLAVNTWRSRDAGHFTNVVGVSGDGAVGYEKALTPFQRLILDDVKKPFKRFVL